MLFRSIPFDAILTFVDPSVEFGLRFESHEEEDEDEDEGEDDLAPFTEVTDEEVKAEEDDKPEADVVSLDSFRK